MKLVGALVLVVGTVLMVVRPSLGHPQQPDICSRHCHQQYTYTPPVCGAPPAARQQLKAFENVCALRKAASCPTLNRAAPVPVSWNVDPARCRPHMLPDCRHECPIEHRNGGPVCGTFAMMGVVAERFPSMCHLVEKNCKAAANIFLPIYRVVECP